MTVPLSISTLGLEINLYGNYYMTPMSDFIIILYNVSLVGLLRNVDFFSHHSPQLSSWRYIFRLDGIQLFIT